MGEARWDNQLFATSVDLREQLNQPMQLTLVRRGVYVGTGKPLSDSLEAVHRQHTGLGTVDQFEAVTNFVEAARQVGRFTYQPAPPVDLLFAGQLEAIRAYTLERPAYYKDLNKLLYNHQNAQKDPQLDAWQEFLLQLDTGLAKLRRHQQAERAASGAQPSKLFRLCWIPTTILQQHYQEGNGVVFKAPVSASPKVLEDFYFRPIQERSLDIAGKECVLFEFDEALSEKAVDIRFVSDYPAEEERVFSPFTRAQVEVQRVWTRFFHEEAQPPARGSRLVDGHPIRHVRLCAVERLEPLPAVLEWNSGIGIEKLIQLGIVIGSHQSDSKVVQTLLQIEERIEMMVTVASIDDFNQFIRLTNPPSLVHLLFALIPWAMMLVNPKGFASQLNRLKEKAQAAIGKALQVPLCKWTETLTTLQEDVGRDMVLEPMSLLRQLRENLQQCQILVQEAESPTALRDTKPEGGEASLPDGDEPEERLLIKSMLGMLIEAALIQGLVNGDPKVCAAMRSPFPVFQPGSLACLQSYQPNTGGQLLHPVLAAIKVGNKVVTGAEKLTEEERTMAVLASLDHLRVHLSGHRIVLPLGLTDAGKSTVLNKVFGLQRPAGLSKASAGRTRTLTFAPCIGMTEVLVADAPGVGDSEKARNDAVSLGLSLADIQGLLQVLVVMASGRDTQSSLDTFAEMLRQHPVPVIVVITHADKRFSDLSKDKNGKPKEMQKRDWWRKQAKDILDEDAERVNKLFPTATKVYTCFAGPFSQSEDTEDDEVDSVNPSFVTAFNEDFKDSLVTADQLKRMVLDNFRLPV